MKQSVWILVATTALGLAGLASSSPADPQEPPQASAPRMEPQVTEGIVHGSVSELWRVFTTAEGFKKLGVAQCDIDLRLSGLIRTHYDPKGVLGDERTIQNEILSFEPERMISFRIQRPPKGFPFSEATWKLTWTVVTLTELADRATHVRISGMGYPDTDEGRAMRRFFESGNASVLAHLQHEFDATVAAPSGPAHASSPLAPISASRVVELPRSAAWKLLTTSAGWRKLFGVDSRIELRPGGRFEVLLEPHSPLEQQGSGGCTVLSLLSEEMVSFTWNAPAKFENDLRPSTWVIVHLEELAPARTRLRIDHVGFAEQALENPAEGDDLKQVRQFFCEEWTKVLDAVQAQGAKR